MKNTRTGLFLSAFFICVMPWLQNFRKLAASQQTILSAVQARNLSKHLVYIQFLLALTLKYTQNLTTFNHHYFSICTVQGTIFVWSVNSSFQSSLAASNLVTQQPKGILLKSNQLSPFCQRSPSLPLFSSKNSKSLLWPSSPRMLQGPKAALISFPTHYLLIYLSPVNDE